MCSKWARSLTLGLIVATFAFAGCGGGSDGLPGANGADGLNGADGADGANGADGADGGNMIDASLVSDEFLAQLDVKGTVTGCDMAGTTVDFTLATEQGVPICGILPFWLDSNRYVRFTIAKLVEGVDGDPNSWVSYTRDSANAPDYDSGLSLVDHGDGSYTFTLLTDCTSVPGVTYEPALTHRVAGQLGSRSVPIEPQNFVHDFVPNGGPLPATRAITTMSTCNECHDDLVFHGRRFEVEYCTNCHNPDLTDGEGNMSYMIHRIHAGGMFAALDHGDPIDYSHVTYPQDLTNCRKCHDGADAATPDGDNWKELPNKEACGGCHTVFDTGTHPIVPDPANSVCGQCHTPDYIERVHLTANATPNNPELLEGQRSITYELIDASVDGANVVTVQLKILSDGTPLNVAALPQDLLDGNRYPGLLLAWAQPQDGIDEPMDYNNLGNRGGQPHSIALDDFSPLETVAPVGSLTFDAIEGVNTFVITDATKQFPVGATLRAVGLQGYLRQDLDDDGSQDVSLHTPSDVIAVTDDDERRMVVDSASCSKCHEWFEGHGGNRTHNIQICTLCHVPNQSSSGRSVTDPSARSLNSILAQLITDGHADPSIDPNDPLTYPEDAQSLKDLVHGIHASGFRDRAYTHVRGPTRQGYYDWSHVTFPRGASTSNCMLCHEEGTFELPLMADLLPTTVRTTGVNDGQDATVGDAELAFQGVPNGTDWINSPTAGSCYACHTSTFAMAHMMQNGALLSVPDGSDVSNRSLFGSTFESCTVCHGPGKVADLELVHNK